MRLIFNADDFGFTKSINNAIINCVKFGTITSTTVMVNMPYYEQAEELLQFKDVGIGLHFNLTQGKSICLPSEISTLVNNDGYFYSVSELKIRIRKGLVSKKHIEKELQAQVNRLRNLVGIRLTHIDSHQDINKFKIVLDTIIEISQNLNLNAIRWYKKAYLIKVNSEYKLKMPSIFNFQKLGFKRVFVELFFKIINLKINRKLITPEGMLYTSNHNTVSLLKIFRDGNVCVNGTNNCFEIMVHPAINMEELYDTSMLESRTEEYRILMSEEFKYGISNFKLVNFQSIKN